jgi:hypothetical protein
MSKILIINIQSIPKDSFSCYDARTDTYRNILIGSSREIFLLSIHEKLNLLMRAISDIYNKYLALKAKDPTISHLIITVHEYFLSLSPNDDLFGVNSAFMQNLDFRINGFTAAKPDITIMIGGTLAYKEKDFNQDFWNKVNLRENAYDDSEKINCLMRNAYSQIFNTGGDIKKIYVSGRVGSVPSKVKAYKNICGVYYNGEQSHQYKQSSSGDGGELKFAGCQSQFEYKDIFYVPGKKTKVMQLNVPERYNYIIEICADHLLGIAKQSLLNQGISMIMNIHFVFSNTIKTIIPGNVVGKCVVNVDAARGISVICNRDAASSNLEIIALECFVDDFLPTGDSSIPLYSAYPKLVARNRWNCLTAQQRHALAESTFFSYKKKEAGKINLDVIFGREVRYCNLSADYYNLSFDDLPLNTQYWLKLVFGEYVHQYDGLPTSNGWCVML